MMARKTNETMEGQRNVRINDRMERWIEGMMDREKKDGQKEQWIERQSRRMNNGQIERQTIE